jgi:hypothetical protein
MEKVAKEYIFLFYVILIIGSGYIGYYTSALPVENGLLGNFLALLLSVILWFTVGKFNSY